MQKIGGSWQPASVRGRLVHAGWGFERSGFPALVLDEDGEEITGHVFEDQGGEEIGRAHV